MSTNADHKVKLSGPPLSRWVSALRPGARRGHRCGAGPREGTPAPQPLRLCNRPGRGCSAPAPRPAAEARPGDPAAGAAPGAVGGWGGLSSRPPGPPPGGQGSRGADTARRGRPRGGPKPRRGRESSATRRALPAHRAGTAGGGSGCRDGGRLAAALAATRPRHVRNRGGGCGGGGGRGTDSPRPRLQAPGPAPSAAARLAPPPPPTAGVKLGPPAGRAGALASDWPERCPPRPLPRLLLGRERRVRGGGDRQRTKSERCCSRSPAVRTARPS